MVLRLFLRREIACAIAPPDLRSDANRHFCYGIVRLRAGEFKAG
jgi:hypothetical protein